MLNVSASLMWLYDGGDIGPLAELKLFARAPRFSRALKITKRADQLLYGLWSRGRTGLIYKPGASARICLTCEQEPSRDSYIALSDDKDRFGMRKARLHWRISPKSWDTIVAFSQTLAALMRRGRCSSTGPG